MAPFRPTNQPTSDTQVPFGSRTDIGNVREQNEDSLIVAPPLFVVADGMGGHAAGEIASEIAVRTIAECAPDQADAEALGEAVEIANREVINAALTGKGREGMGTTCTAAMLEGNRLVIAQVGDSRAYLLHAGKLSQLTRDHSLVADMVESGQITREQARYHPKRSVITRALGNDINMLPDLYEINVEDGDRILLCSDGLHAMLPDEEIEAALNRTPDPQVCADALVDAALAMGGLDNITVIVIDVEGKRGTQRKRMAQKTKLTVCAVLIMLAVFIGLAAWGGVTYLNQAAYLTANDAGYVQVYRGVPGEVLGFRCSELVETTEIKVTDLNSSAASNIKNDMRVANLDEAYDLIEAYREQLEEKRTSATAGGTARGETEASATSTSATNASAGTDTANTSTANTATAGGGGA